MHLSADKINMCVDFVMALEGGGVGGGRGHVVSNSICWDTLKRTARYSQAENASSQSTWTLLVLYTMHMNLAYPLQVHFPANPSLP